MSRLLPCRRQEKGHTLRSEFSDDGTQDAVGLVFNLTNPQSHKTMPEHVRINGTITRRWPPMKNSNPANDAQLLGALDNQSPRIGGLPEWAGDYSDVENARMSRGDGQTGVGELQRPSGTGEKRRLSSTLRRIFGSLKRTKGEKGRKRSNSEPSSSQSAQILESKETRLETPNIISDEKEITKTQQIFDEKRFRREQRRSLRESGDFLGVQGANPRTGYWDISDATISSEPSQMSEKTKLRLNQQAVELAEQKKKYEEARKTHQEELVKVQTMKELKRKEKEEQKKTELKLRQGRHGKWKLSENGWSSVVEPELSPIQQSVAGSPVAGKSKCWARRT